ncbi:MAG: hypothetical protein K2H89_07395 [Oscillospiraceae bacterium]|nr:hypothetical protein [Oscillospiraceae bacterium]
MAKTIDVVQLRERRKRRKRLFQLLILLAVVLLGALIYTSREKWFSKFQQISSSHSNLKAETDGEYMLTVSGGVDYHAEFVSHDLFVLCDKYIYIYDMNGELLDSRQHAYSNAIMKTNASRALTYSHNGTNFRVDQTKKMFYEETLEQPIWFAVLSEDGRVAVVTESETYACCLYVYDTNGKCIYTRNCLERLIDVSFQEDGCICATIGAENGEIVTVLKYIQFQDSDVKWTSDALPALCWRVHSLKDGGAFVIGDTETAYYSNTGNLLNTCLYSGTLIDCDFSNDKAAVLLKNESRRQSVLLLFSGNSENPVSVSFDSICKNVKIQDDTVYLLDAGVIKSYSFTGTELSSLEIKDAYDKILKNGKYFYLLGYDRIQRVNAG